MIFKYQPHHKENVCPQDEVKKCVDKKKGKNILQKVRTQNLLS
jgi:hypothetical protein